MRRGCYFWRQCIVASLLLSSILSISYSRQASAEANYLSIAPYAAEKDGEEAFLLFSQSVAAIMRPPLIQGAKSLGEAGSEFTFVTTYAGLFAPEFKEHPSYWKTAFVEGEPTRHFFVGNLGFRKGLANSFDLALNASYAFNTNVIGLAIDFKYAFLEGYTYAPDLAMILSFSTIAGIRDFAQFGVTFALVASKEFGISGTFSITPRVAYQLLYSASGTLPLPVKPEQFPQSGETKSFYHFIPKGFEEKEVSGIPIDQRLIAGLDFNIWIVKILLETSYQVPDKTLQIALGLGLTY